MTCGQAKRLSFSFDEQDGNLVTEQYCTNHTPILWKPLRKELLAKDKEMYGHFATVGYLRTPFFLIAPKSQQNDRFAIVSVGYDHITNNTPVPVRSQKLNFVKLA